jgi:hypothetical protein
MARPFIPIAASQFSLAAVSEIGYRPKPQLT